jgi:hypothetical protein
MKLEGFLFYVDQPYIEPYFCWYKYDMSTSANYFLVKPYTIDIEIPEGLDLTALTTKGAKETLQKDLAHKLSEVAEIEAKLAAFGGAA